jgi:hypothetical protein
LTWKAGRAAWRAQSPKLPFFYDVESEGKIQMNLPLSVMAMDSPSLMGGAGQC